MRKFLPISLCLFLLSFVLNANPISPERAMKIASAFMAKNANSLKSFGNDELKISYVSKNSDVSGNGLRSLSGVQQPENLYYVINRGDNNGFVVIAGDDVVSSVLAFSETGSMNAQSIHNHPSISWLFSEYENQLKYALSHTKAGSTTRGLTDGNLADINGMEVVVEPLLRYYQDRKTRRPYTISFGQDWPFNDLCPNMTFKDKYGKKRVIPTVSGCVATCISTVMRWHEWPNDPVGQVSYKWNKYVMSLDFDHGDKGETAGYDWKVMPAAVDAYGKNRATRRQCTEAEADQIARLLRDVGYAVKMDYGIAQDGGSGTQVYYAPPVLIKNFGYDKACKWIRRNAFGTKKEWMDQVVDELKNYGPIIYAGFSTGGGHCFCLDGYATTGKYTTDRFGREQDPNDYVHVDWGWNGMENGWYKIDILQPGSEGIGGGAGGYKTNQQMVRFLKPNRKATPTPPSPEPTPVPTPTPKPTPKPEKKGYSLVVTDLSGVVSFEKNTKGQKLTVNVKNEGNESFYGQKLYLAVIANNRGYIIGDEYRYIGKNTETNVSFYGLNFDNVSNGDYKLALAADVDGKKTIITNVFGSCRIYTKGNDDKVEPVVPEKMGAVISLASGERISKGSVVEGSASYKTNIVFENSGDENFNGTLTIYVGKGVYDVKKVASGIVRVNASQQLDATVTADIKGLEAGNYNFYASYNLNGKEVFVKDYRGYNAVVGTLEITKKYTPRPEPRPTPTPAYETQIVQTNSYFYQDDKYLGFFMPTVRYYGNSFSVKTYVDVKGGAFTGEIKVFLTTSADGTTSIAEKTYNVERLMGNDRWVITEFSTEPMYLNRYYIGVMYRAKGEYKWKMMPNTHKPFNVSFSYYDYRGEYSDKPTSDKREYLFEEPAMTSIGGGTDEPERQDGDAVPTGIDQVVNNTTAVYPTVTSDNINVVVEKSTIAQLVDMSGAIVKEISLHNDRNTLSLSDLSAGSYILKVNGKTFKVYKK